jgi:RNA polymerase-binding transcription factor DksA
MATAKKTTASRTKAAPAQAAAPTPARAAKSAPKKAASAPAKAAPAAAKKAPTAAASAAKQAPVDGKPKASKDFDQKFLEAQKKHLIEERAALTGQAQRLESEANSLIEDVEMGDVQFDDESGEGDTMVVERERDLALSAQARQMVADIDVALERMANGTYGYSVISGRPIPKERLKAIPWATVLVEEKVGGIGRR